MTVDFAYILNDFKARHDLQFDRDVAERLRMARSAVNRYRRKETVPSFDDALPKVEEMGWVLVRKEELARLPRLNPTQPLALRAGSIADAEGLIDWLPSMRPEDASVASVVGAGKWSLGEGPALLIRSEAALDRWPAGATLIARRWPEGAEPPQGERFNAIVRWDKWGQDRLRQVFISEGSFLMLPLGATLDHVEAAKVGEVEIVAILCGAILPD